MQHKEILNNLWLQSQKDLFQSLLKQIPQSSNPMAVVLSAVLLVELTQIMVFQLLDMVQKVEKISGFSRTHGAQAGEKRVSSELQEMLPRMDQESVVSNYKHLIPLCDYKSLECKSNITSTNKLTKYCVLSIFHSQITFRVLFIN